MAWSRGKPDQNHGEIKAGLERVGAFPVDLRATGGGIPDLAVWFRGATHWLEIKSSAAEARRNTSTAQRQREIRDRARERGVHIYVVTDLDEALRAIGAIK